MSDVVRQRFLAARRFPRFSARRELGLALALILALAACGGEGDTGASEGSGPSSQPDVQAEPAPARVDDPPAEVAGGATAERDFPPPRVDELQFYPSDEAPVSEKVRESVQIGAVVFREAYFDTLARLEARSRELEKEGDEAGSLSVRRTLYEVRRLREAALGQRVVVAPESGAVIQFAPPLIELLDSGLRGCGLLLPRGGWYPDPRRAIAAERSPPRDRRRAIAAARSPPRDLSCAIAPAR